MRLILSRKGFDAQYGGVPSPILPDGRMFSLPIPSHRDATTLGELTVEGINLGTLAADLTANRINAATTVHFDPDLYGPALDRAENWRPAFGQISSAQSHLKKQGVCEGDLFLFFGWFRRVDRIDGRWQYVPGSPDVHALFGWLQVGEVLPVSGALQPIVDRYPWLERHPHIASAGKFSSINNTIYVASGSLRLNGSATGLAGGGIFNRCSSALTLTAAGRTRSIWRMPAWVSPSGRRSSLSYHGNPTRWVEQGDSVLLQTVAKGQEFVLDCDHFPEAVSWLTSLFQIPATVPSALPL